MNFKTIDQLSEVYFDPKKETIEDAIQLWIYEVVGIAQSNVMNWFETKKSVSVACCKTLTEIDEYIKDLASYCYYEGIPFARKEKFTFIVCETAFSCFRYFEDFETTEKGKENIWRRSLLDLPIEYTHPDLKDMGKDFKIKGYELNGSVTVVKSLNSIPWNS